MKVTFLSADVPLTKEFFMKDGVIDKTAHPRVINCTSYEEEFETIEELHELLVKHAELGHCMLKGNVKSPLVNQSRAGSTDSNEPSRLLVFDLDGYENARTVSEFLKQVDCDQVDYIVQYSSSTGIDGDKRLRAHIFILLDKPWVPGMLKQWLMHLNMTTDSVRQAITLTRTGNALRWPLDISVCQSDKLIYITPPKLGKDVKCTFTGKRIQLQKRKKKYLSISTTIPTAEANKNSSMSLLNELRKKAGLPERKRITFKQRGQVEYMHNPDQATITGMKSERGWRYFNLNGGDSWSYYHHEDNPEFIHNFKGEPVYRTCDLLPEYWAEAKKVLEKPKVSSNGIVYLAFRDFRTSNYWNGSWNPDTETANFSIARGKEQLADYMAQYGLSLGPYIPDWTIEFNPNSDETVSVEKKIVNTFRKTEYMKRPRKVVKDVPPTIRRIAMHMLGNDEECFEHMMNYLACIYQYRQRNETAWVMHGIQGTGKGVFFNRVLRAIFGHVTTKRMSELDSQFNGFLENNLLIMIDEAQLSAHKMSKVMNANLKNYITEPFISIRHMHCAPYEARNYINMFFVGNEGDVITIEPTDRRFNVALFQPERFVTSTEELENMEKEELSQFADYLGSRKADKEQARTALNNPAKQRMILVSQNSMEVACAAIREGNFTWLWEQRPNVKSLDGAYLAEQKASAYMQLLQEIVGGKRSNLVREEIQMILDYTIGGIPDSPYKLASMLKHYRIVFEPLKRDGRTVRGIKVEWKIPDEIREEMK